jgi:hypothetical protein
MTDGRTKVLGTVAKRTTWREPAENNYTGDSDTFEFTIPERDDVKITVVPDNKSEPIIFLVATFGAGGVYGAVVGAGASGKKNVPAEFTGPAGTYFLKLDLLGAKPGGYDLVIERKSGVAPVIMPSVRNDTFEVPAEAAKKGFQLDVLANDSPGSAPIDTKSLTIDVPPAHGTATIKKGQVVYKPNSDNPGTDFFMYSVKGADGARSGFASVDLRIEASPNAPPPASAVPPQAVDDRFILNAAELGKKGVALDILVNDTASTGNLNLKSAQIVDAPGNGTASIRKGTLLYKPDPGFEGTDTLAYTVADASGRASNPAQVRIEVRQPDPPRAADDRFTLNAAELGKKGVALDILVNDTPATGSLNLKSAQIVDAPDHGTASIRKGTLLYKLDPGFEGTDTLAYTVADASGRASNPAQVRIEVRQPDPPRAADDRFTLNAAEIGKKGAVLDILDNDTPATGVLNLKSVQIVDAPDHGTASVKKGVLLYKPDAGFTGTDTLAYTVADASGRPSNPAQVRIDVRQPDGSNDQPPPLPPPLPPGPSGPLAAGPLIDLAGSAPSTPLALADVLDTDDAIGTFTAAKAASPSHAAAPPPGPTLESLVTATDDPAALA